MHINAIKTNLITWYMAEDMIGSVTRGYTKFRNIAFTYFVYISIKVVTFI